MRYLVSFMVVLALALMPAMASASDCDCITNNCTYTIYAASDADLPVDQSGDPIEPGANNRVDWRWDYVRTLTSGSNSINATIDGTDVDETIYSDSETPGSHCRNGTGTINDDCQSHMVRSGKSGYFRALYFGYLMYQE